MPAFRVTVLFSLLRLAVFVAGCEHQTAKRKPKKDPLVQALSQVGFNNHDVHGVGPASWEELATMAGDDQAKLAAMETVKDKGHNLKWGVKLSSLTEGMANTVMGESPQGGPKLMFGASTRI